MGRIILLIFCGLFTLTGFCQEKVVASFIANDAVNWELGRKPYDAILEFIKYTPPTTSDEADSLRISFSIGNNKMWSLTVDTLCVHTKRRVGKIFIDGVYARDSITKEIEYRVKGHSMLKSYDRTNGIPDEIVYKGHTYFPISKALYDVIEVCDNWPTIESSGDVIELFQTTYNLIGQDSVYSIKSGGNKEVIAKVFADRMEISLIQDKKLIKKFNFTSADESHTIHQWTRETGRYIRAFTQKGDNSPYIEINETSIAFVEPNSKIRLDLDGTILSNAVNLAKKRKILNDDNALNYYGPYGFF